MINTIRVVSAFFSKSTKRETFLIENVKQYTPNERHNILIDVCRPRWVKRIDGLDRFEEMYEVVMLTVQAIYQNADHSWDPETANTYGTLLCQFTHVR